MYDLELHWPTVLLSGKAEPTFNLLYDQMAYQSKAVEALRALGVATAIALPADPDPFICLLAPGSPEPDEFEPTPANLLNDVIETNARANTHKLGRSGRSERHRWHANLTPRLRSVVGPPEAIGRATPREVRRAVWAGSSRPSAGEHPRRHPWPSTGYRRWTDRRGDRPTGLGTIPIRPRRRRCRRHRPKRRSSRVAAGRGAALRPRTNTTATVVEGLRRMAAAVRQPTGAACPYLPQWGSPAVDSPDRGPRRWRRAAASGMPPATSAGSLAWKVRRSQEHEAAPCGPRRPPAFSGSTWDVAKIATIPLITLRFLAVGRLG